ncbi:hypothetical protein BD779DRAFT_1470287 [Infundibulicybe gibba]|nr:hypothetical protein BD779DRAFT_1470287 [Infundibulicybe gibba]
MSELLLSAAHALDSQVGGHAGVLTSEDGAILIKATLPAESQFYQSLSRADSGFAPLKPFVPAFHGVIASKEDPNEKAGASPAPQKDKFGVQQRNVSSPQHPKILRKVHKGSRPACGIARFFPVGDGNGSPDSSKHGLPLALLLSVIRGVRRDIAQIRDILASIEMRMVGGSLLIIYEADWSRAQDSPPGYIVKLIDFAHTKLAPGMGLDAGVLLGVDTVLRLLDGRIEELTRE